MLTWAVAQGFRPDNPADAVKAVLPKHNGNGAKAHRALPYSEVADAIAAVRASGAAPVLKLAFEYLVLTAARAGEIRFATWSEIDLASATWTVPASRMKAGREHRVPLSPRALAILDEAQALRSRRGDLVFPSRGGRPLTERGFVQALARLGIDATAHGFRASFRVWAQERTNIPREVCEAALAHTFKDKVDTVRRRRAGQAGVLDGAGGRVGARRAGSSSRWCSGRYRPGSALAGASTGQTMPNSLAAMARMSAA